MPSRVLAASLAIVSRGSSSVGTCIRRMLGQSVEAFRSPLARVLPRPRSGAVDRRPGPGRPRGKTVAVVDRGRRSSARPSIASIPTTETPARSRRGDRCAGQDERPLNGRSAHRGDRPADPGHRQTPDQVGELGASLHLNSRTRTAPPMSRMTSGRRCSSGSWYSKIAEYSPAAGSWLRTSLTSRCRGAIESSHARVAGTKRPEGIAPGSRECTAPAFHGKSGTWSSNRTHGWSPGTRFRPSAQDR